MDDIEDRNNTQCRTITLDIEYYQSFLDDTDMPEDQKREFIETLWKIVLSFVDLGFDIHPLQQASDNIETRLHPAIVKMISDVANEDLNTIKETPLEGIEE